MVKIRYILPKWIDKDVYSYGTGTTAFLSKIWIKRIWKNSDILVKRHGNMQNGEIRFILLKLKTSLHPANSNY